MKKYLLLVFMLTILGISSCSSEDEEVNGGDGVTQVVLTLKSLDGEVKAGYHVFVFEELEDIKSNSLIKAVKRQESDNKGQVIFDFDNEVKSSKFYYFGAYENTGKDMYPSKSIENTKIEVKKGFLKKVVIKVK